MMALACCSSELTVSDYYRRMMAKGVIRADNFGSFDTTVDATIYCGEFLVRDTGPRAECAKPDGHAGFHQSYEYVASDAPGEETTVRYSWPN